MTSKNRPGTSPAVTTADSDNHRHRGVGAEGDLMTSAKIVLRVRELMAAESDKLLRISTMQLGPGSVERRRVMYTEPESSRAADSRPNSDRLNWRAARI